MRTAPLPAPVLDLALQRLPDDVKAGLRAMGPRAVLAGGYLRTLATQVYPGPAHRSFVEAEPKDIDIFVPDTEAMSQLASYLWSGRKCVGYVQYMGGMPAWRRTLTFKPRAEETAEVQIIGEWAFAGAVDVVANIDFRVSAVALWWNGAEWRGVTDEDWLKNVQQRIADYRSNAPNPAGTLLRLARYLGLGYHVRPEELTCIAARGVEQARVWHQRDPWREKQPGFKPDLRDVMYDMCLREVISPDHSLIPPWEEPRFIPPWADALQLAQLVIEEA